MVVSFRAAIGITFQERNGRITNHNQGRILKRMLNAIDDLATRNHEEKITNS
jgi:hypothetical protein